MTKKTIEVREITHNFRRYNLSLESLNVIFDSFIKTNPSFSKDKLFLDIDYSYGQYDEIDIEAYINGSREETDEEYSSRLAKEQEKKDRDKENARKSMENARLKREEKDRKEYERLKKKFGGSQ